MCLLAGTTGLTAQAMDKPNVIFILGDDIGYTDLGCYGATKIKTPAINSLAKQGVLFSNAYSPAATSSPSRYSLLTGEYAWRNNVGILPADAPLSISLDAVTLPKLFKTWGYSTGIVGKWHLGLGQKNNKVNFNSKIENGPVDIGFDYAYYFPATNDRVPCVYIENYKVVGLEASDPLEVSYSKKTGNAPAGCENPDQLNLKYHLGHDGTIVNGVSRIGWMKGGSKALWKDDEMAEHLTNQAVEFIENSTDTPFFLYYAPHNAHEPRIPSEKFKGKSKAGIYGDVIEEFDYNIGRIIKTLKAKGIYENTIIILSSDNGPMVKEGYDDGALENLNGHNPYGNLRGEKYSLHEGGTRVPFIFSWPAKIKKPFVQSQPFVYLDMIATFPNLLKLFTKPLVNSDAEDASELFIKKDAETYREYILLQNNNGDIALRIGAWKYYPSKGELYNLDEDPSELRNVVYAYPLLVREFKEFAKIKI